MLKSISSLKPLYNKDYLLWLQCTVDHLRHRRLDQLDWENLIEEIEDLARNEKRKASSYLRQLLIHLLIYQYWQTEREYSGRGWREEIGNFRYELKLLFQSKTLLNFILGEFDSIYQSARKAAINKSGLIPELFPQESSFSLDDILDDDFFPECDR